MSTPAATSPRTLSPWLGVVAVVATLVFRLANATITSTELPALEQEFNVPGATAELTLTLFLAIAGALVAPVGVLADRFGHIRVFTIGTLGMVGANLLSAVSPTFSVLLFSRILEALAFPAMGAASLALVASMFTEQKQRARAFALYGAGFGLGLAAGAVLGGVFTQEVSWRWSFAMNIPILLVCVVAVRRTLGTRGKTNPERRLDVGGMILLVTTLVCLLLGLNSGPDDGWLGFPGLLVLIAVVATVWLVIHEHRRRRAGKQVLFEARLLESRGYLPAAGVSFLMMFVTFSMLTVVPLYWSIVSSLGPMAIGFGIATVGVGWAAGAAISSPLGERYGARTSVTIGLIVAAIFLAVTAVILAQFPDPWHTALPLLFLGVGTGTAYARLNEAGLKEVPRSLTGLGAGTLIAIRLVGGALGTLVLSQLLLFGATEAAHHEIDSAQLDPSVATELKHAVSAAARGHIGPLTDPNAPNASTLFEDQHAAYASGAKWVLGFGSIILLAAAVVSRRLPGRDDVPA